jgi:hypothetical protein
MSVRSTQSSVEFLPLPGRGFQTGASVLALSLSAAPSSPGLFDLGGASKDLDSASNSDPSFILSKSVPFETDFLFRTCYLRPP